MKFPLPEPKKGMRRIWNILENKWSYIPQPFPSNWKKNEEFLIWDDETDNWEIITKDGKLILVENENHVTNNLRLRNMYLNNISRLDTLMKKLSLNGDD